eukprot:1767943-Rhodomonas_salina.1
MSVSCYACHDSCGSTEMYVACSAYLDGCASTGMGVPCYFDSCGSTDAGYRKANAVLTPPYGASICLRISQRSPQWYYRYPPTSISMPPPIPYLHTLLRRIPIHPVVLTLAMALPGSYDGLIVPGGRAPEYLALDPQVCPRVAPVTCHE